MRRYEKHARLAMLVAQVPPQLLKRVAAEERQLPQRLAGACVKRG